MSQYVNVFVRMFIVLGIGSINFVYNFFVGGL